MNFEELSEFARSFIKTTKEEWLVLFETLKDDAAMNAIMKREWLDKPRDSDQAVIEYYRNSKIWFVNTFNHAYRALLALANRDSGGLSREVWHQFFESELSPGDRILDYGGGFWSDTAILALDGWHVTQAEVMGPTTDFLTAFVNVTGTQKNLQVLPVDSGFPILESYDGITCFELLEHLLHPKEFTIHLRDHLKSGKPFASSVSFGAPEHAPYHVASNAPLSHEHVWTNTLWEMGFEQIWAPRGSHRRIWRKR
jgi:2-polyprenyl-3-methyl-5-hydroxy-6-metoxy-1,4-benzoquinol methylase